MIEFEYTCPEHGDFKIEVALGEEIPEWSLCPHTEDHKHETCLNEYPCKYMCMISSSLKFTTK